MLPTLSLILFIINHIIFSFSMAPIIENIKSVVEIKPVHAWGEAKDVKLTARSFDHYTLAEPSRYDVFKANYMRRLHQSKAEGYFSVPWRPYQDVGHPLHLDLKTIVKTALGQTTDTPRTTLRDDSRESLNTEVSETEGRRIRRKMSTATFLMQHRRYQNLENISKYLTDVNTTKLSVKKGRSLFKLLKEEKEQRDKNLQDEKLKNLQERSKGTSSEETESNSTPQTQEDKLRKEFQDKKKAALQRTMSVKTLMTRPMSSPVTSTTSMTEVTGPVLLKAKKSKPIGEQVPPYTPVYAPNIMKVTPSKKFTTDCMETLRKELCALHWLIEACNLEANSRFGLTNYIPLLECWQSTTHPGGVVLEAGKRTKKYDIEGWNRIVQGQTIKSPRSKIRRMTAQRNLFKRTPSFADFPHSPSDFRGPNSPRISTRSQSIAPPPSPMVQVTKKDIFDMEYRAPSPAQSSVTTVATGGRAPIAGSEQDDDAFTTRSSLVEEEDVSQYHVNLQKLLSTVKESVDKEMLLRETAADVKANMSGKQRAPVYIWAKQLYIEELNKDDKEQTTKKHPDVASSTKRTTVKIRPHTAAPKKVTVHHADEAQLRPKSSPPKLTRNYYRSLSFRKERMPEEMREKFREVSDIKALELHNQLGELGRKQCERMEKKFKCLQRPQSSMHRDLSDMRDAVEDKHQMHKKKMSKKEAARNMEWFVILQQNVPSDCEEMKIIMNGIETLAAKFAGWVDEGVHREHPMIDRLQYSSNADLRNRVAESIYKEDVQSSANKRRSSSVRSLPRNTKDVEITADAFLRVLNTLRVWELCAPEVSAAIEFVREFVVGMAPQQYEEWRSERLQREQKRPSSAPHNAR